VLSCFYAAEHLASYSAKRVAECRSNALIAVLRMGQGPIPTVHRKPRRMAPTQSSRRAGACRFGGRLLRRPIFGEVPFIAR
jgi:hypothetical protein